MRPAGSWEKVRRALNKEGDTAGVLTLSLFFLGGEPRSIRYGSATVLLLASDFTCITGGVEKVGMDVNHPTSPGSSHRLEKLLQSFTVSASSATSQGLCWIRWCLEGLGNLMQMCWNCLEQGIKRRGG